jgi:hypothetical protein
MPIAPVPRMPLTALLCQQSALPVHSRAVLRPHARGTAMRAQRTPRHTAHSTAVLCVLCIALRTPRIALLCEASRAGLAHLLAHLYAHVLAQASLTHRSSLRTSAVITQHLSQTPTTHPPLSLSLSLLLSKHIYTEPQQRLQAYTYSIAVRAVPPRHLDQEIEGGEGFEGDPGLPGVGHFVLIPIHAKYFYRGAVLVLVLVLALAT